MLATVQELKSALETEQTRALEVADRATDAINTLLTLSTWTLTILAIVVGLIAVFGYGLILSSAKKASQKVAADAVESYIKSQAFQEKLEDQISREVRERLKDKVILANLTPEPTTDEPDAFPKAEERR